MPTKLRLNLTISRETVSNLKKRDNFNASAFFEQSYRKAYMNVATLKKRLFELDEERKKLEKQIEGISEVSEPEIKDRDSCPICLSRYHEDIRWRNRQEIVPDLYACRQCIAFRNDEVKRFIEKSGDNQR